MDQPEVNNWENLFDSWWWGPSRKAPQATRSISIFDGQDRPRGATGLIYCPGRCSGGPRRGPATLSLTQESLILVGPGGGGRNPDHTPDR